MALSVVVGDCKSSTFDPLFDDSLTVFLITLADLVDYCLLNFAELASIIVAVPRNRA